MHLGRSHDDNALQASGSPDRSTISCVRQQLQQQIHECLFSSRIPNMSVASLFPMTLSHLRRIEWYLRSFSMLYFKLLSNIRGQTHFIEAAESSSWCCSKDTISFSANYTQVAATNWFTSWTHSCQKMLQQIQTYRLKVNQFKIQHHKP